MEIAYTYFSSQNLIEPNFYVFSLYTVHSFYYTAPPPTHAHTHTHTFHREWTTWVPIYPPRPVRKTGQADHDTLHTTESQVLSQLTAKVSSTEHYQLA